MESPPAEAVRNLAPLRFTDSRYCISWPLRQAKTRRLDDLDGGTTTKTPGRHDLGDGGHAILYRNQTYTNHGTSGFLPRRWRGCGAMRVAQLQAGQNPGDHGVCGWVGGIPAPEQPLDHSTTRPPLPKSPNNHSTIRQLGHPCQRVPDQKAPYA